MYEDGERLVFSVGFGGLGLYILAYLNLASTIEKFLPYGCGYGAYSFPTNYASSNIPFLSDLVFKHPRILVSV
jgi:hypothetical protein